MRLKLILASMILGMSVLPAAAQSILTYKSTNDFQTTLAKLDAAVAKRNFTRFATIDHAANAATAGQTLRPTHLMIFGNATGGTVVMNCKQTAGLDLPLKALVWEDADGTTQVSVPVTASMAERQQLGTCASDVIEAMDGVLREIATEAAAR